MDWEQRSVSSSGSEHLPLPQRATSDPAGRSPKVGEEDLRRCQSWPPPKFPLQMLTAEILATPFQDKARARARTMESGPTVSHELSALGFASWVVFGASGWWSTNVITAQLPLLAEVLPEGKALGNKLSAMAQFGNLFLAAYMLSRRHTRVDPSTVIITMMTLGFAALGGCALFWDSVFPGESLPLLAFSVIAGGVGCTSGVIYWTFLLLYPPRCTIAASVGMSFGGVVANILSAAQLCGLPASLSGPAQASTASALGVPNGGARFGPTAFFTLAAGLQLFSIFSFLCVRQTLPKATSLAELNTPLSHEDALGRLREVFGERPSSEVREQEELHRRATWGFCSLNFFVRGVTYLMPTLMPYVAGAYPELRVQLLFWMLLGQQVGETTGRALQPSPGRAVVIGGLAVVVFSTFAVIAVSPLVLSSWVPQTLAQLCIPAACTFYFLSYGMIETAVFKWIRGVSKRSCVVEDISALAGSCGQMGSLTSTFLVFLCFELHPHRS